MFQGHTALRYLFILIPTSDLGSCLSEKLLAGKEAFFVVGFATLLTLAVAFLRHTWTEIMGFIWWGILGLCLGSLHAPILPKSITTQGNYAYVIEPARKTAKTYRCVLQLESNSESPQKYWPTSREKLLIAKPFIMVSAFT